MIDSDKAPKRKSKKKPRAMSTDAWSRDSYDTGNDTFDCDNERSIDRAKMVHNGRVIRKHIGGA